MFSVVSHINLEQSKKIEEVSSQEAYSQILSSLQKLEKKILEHREYMLRFIDKKDSSKYRKYLNI